jgi:hypothetical protein
MQFMSVTLEVSKLDRLIDFKLQQLRKIKAILFTFVVSKLVKSTYSKL